MPKSYDEKIAEVKQKIEQEQNRMKQLIQKQRQEERKARTRRLIERGAILESLIAGADGMTNEEIKAILQSAFPQTTAGEMPETEQETRA